MPMRALVAFLIACCVTLANPAHAADLKSALQAAVANPNDQEAFEALKSVLPVVTLPNGSTLYVFEGDILRNEEQLLDYLRELRSDSRSTSDAGKRNPELIVNKIGDKQDFYETLSARHLTYSIDKQNFSPAEFAKVEDDVRQATRQWMAKCPTCNISFDYKPQYNAAPSTTQTTFVVTKVNAGKFFATSFFPSDPPERKLLLIDQTYFDEESFDRVGILRHEVGHILGYRHEHLSEQSGCKLDPETGQWEPLTAYDPLSVMHYFCNGHGTRKLEISDLDELGHRCLYDTSYAAANPNACRPGQAARNAQQRVETIAAKLSGPSDAALVIASQVTLRNSPTLSVRFNGGDIPKNLVQIIDLMINAGAIKPIDYMVQPGDYVCLLYRQIMDWPALLKCPNDLQSLAARLNGRSRAQMERLRIGETIKVVPLLSLRSYQSRRVCTDACDRRGTALQTYRVSEKKYDSGSIEEQFLFYELKVPIDDRKLLEKLDQTIKEQQNSNLFSEIVEVQNGQPTRPKFDSPVARAPASNFLDLCFSGQINQNHRAWYSDFVGEKNLPACALTCAGTGCADVVLLDGGVIYGNANLDGAIKHPVIKFAKDPTNNPATCTLVPDANSDKYHATMMAGIIGARQNHFPFVGMSPATQISLVDVDRPDGTISEDISHYVRRNSVVVTATQYPVVVGGSAPNSLPRPEMSQVNWAFENAKSLVVAAAGQAKDPAPGVLFTRPTELTPNTNAAPANIGDHEYVIVVTACSDCSDDNATLWDKAHWSDKGMVHLAAPGRGIPSLGDDSRFMTAGGTSTATAFVGGVAASMMNCFHDAYDQPWKIKSRLQLTARPVLTGEDNRRVTGGIIDAHLALMDPNKTWVKLVGNTSYEEVDNPAWCVPEIKLSDPSGRGPLAEGNTDTDYVRRLRRMADGTYVVFKQPPWDRYQDKAEHYQAKMSHTLPGVPNVTGNLLSTSKGNLPIEQIEDLVLPSPLHATSGCKKNAISSSN